MGIININEGITYDGNTFIVDFKNNTTKDIISIAKPYINKSSILDNVYYFGYKFTEDVDSRIRTKFIHYLKGIGENVIDSITLGNLIALPLNELNKKENLSTFGCLLYSRSNRSNLVYEIHNIICTIVPHLKTNSFELIKQLPQTVTFDWDMFDTNYIGELDDYRYQQIYNYIQNELLPKVHSLDYFSIAENVKSKYRKYITNFLDFADDRSKKAFCDLQHNKVLIVDDINTTQSTLNEIIRIVITVNPEIEIYIFTLIGK